MVADETAEQSTALQPLHDSAATLLKFSLSRHKQIQLKALLLLEVAAQSGMYPLPSFISCSPCRYPLASVFSHFCVCVFSLPPHSLFACPTSTAYLLAPHSFSFFLDDPFASIRNAQGHAQGQMWLTCMTRFRLSTIGQCKRHCSVVRGSSKLERKSSNFAVTHCLRSNVQLCVLPPRSSLC